MVLVARIEISEPPFGASNDGQFGPAVPDPWMRDRHRLAPAQ